MSEHYRELLLGGGARRNKQLHKPDRARWHELTVLDINPDHEPDLQYRAGPLFPGMVRHTPNHRFD